MSDTPTAATVTVSGEAQLRADHCIIEYIGGPSPYLWIGTPAGKFVGAVSVKELRAFLRGRRG